MREETLRALKDAGLTSITIGIETPDEKTLQRYSRVAINDDRQRDFVALCRRLGIRTVAGFMIGFPGDTKESIYQVLNYARAVNPTYANFNIVTPYPGTEFYDEVKNEIADHDFSKYSVYRACDEVSESYCRGSCRAARSLFRKVLLPSTLRERKRIAVMASAPTTLLANADLKRMPKLHGT